MEKKSIKNLIPSLSPSSAQPTPAPVPKPNAMTMPTSHAMPMPNTMTMPTSHAMPMPNMPQTLPASQMPGKSNVKPITKAHCKSHMHRYVEVQSADGCLYDGIVEYVDDEWLCLAVPGAVEPMRGFFPGPFGYGGYGGFGGFGGPFYRPRRFNRLVLPLAGLTALALLPYYW